MVSDLRKSAWRYCVLALLLVSANAPATVVLSIDADPSTPGVQSTRDVQAGDIINVDVVISNVDLFLPVNGFDLTVTFDDAVLLATGVTSGGYFSSSLPLIETLGATSVQYAEVALAIPVTTVGNVLFSIAFTVVGQDSTAVALDGASKLTGVQSLNVPPFIDPGANVPFQPQSATLTASTATVPTPPVGLLLLTGMLMLYRATKRQRSRGYTGSPVHRGARSMV